MVRKEELDEVRCSCVMMGSVFSLYRSFYDFHRNIRFLAGNVQTLLDDRLIFVLLILILLIVSPILVGEDPPPPPPPQCEISLYFPH